MWFCKWKCAVENKWPARMRSYQLHKVSRLSLYHTQVKNSTIPRRMLTMVEVECGGGIAPKNETQTLKLGLKQSTGTSTSAILHMRVEAHSLQTPSCTKLEQPAHYIQAGCKIRASTTSLYILYLTTHPQGYLG